jgi:hypothetical protein
VSAIHRTTMKRMSPLLLLLLLPLFALLCVHFNAA